MTRGRALTVLILVVGGLVVLSLSTIVAGTEKAPARYAQLQADGHALDIWRDNSTGQLTFHWVGDNASEATRYLPKQSALAEMSDGQVLSVNRFQSGAAAWNSLHGLYGVTRKQVYAALASGTLSPLPPTAGDHVAKAGHEAATHFGLNIAGLAAATRLTLPRLRSLGGYPLVAVIEGNAYGPVEGGRSGAVAVLAYGKSLTGNSPITLNIAAYTPGNHAATGTVYKRMYESSRWPHRQGPVRYQQTDENDILFPYRGEWIGVTANAQSRQEWAAIIRTILRAPTS